MLTADELREIVDYDPETGAMIWKKDTGKRRFIGKPVGALKRYPNGYVTLSTSIKKQKVVVHRLAWLYHYGEWPSSDIDHINGDATDNRIANLRLASKTQNQANRKIPSHNKSGFKGVWWSKQINKWCAEVRLNRRKIHIGTFDDASEAAAAYLAKAREVFGEFATDGRGR